MLQTTVDNFHQNLQQEVDYCIENHEILHVKRQQGEDFVVISAADWRAIAETLFLNRIPRLVASIHQADQEPLDQGTLLKDIEQKINFSNLSEKERYLLRGSVTYYEAPTEPVAMEDWDVLK